MRMSKWSAGEIKILRLRLGWSTADFSRRLGCTSQTITSWELDLAAPTADDERQLDRLAFYIESYSQQLAIEPLAEIFLREEGLCQVHQEQVARKLDN
jgi:transcriptional regulator with XRE-family HTH domain